MKKLRISKKDVLWMKIGKLGDLHQHKNIKDAAIHLADNDNLEHFIRIGEWSAKDVISTIEWVDRGFFLWEDMVELYWGDKNGNWIRDIGMKDRGDFIKNLLPILQGYEDEKTKNS